MNPLHARWEWIKDRLATLSVWRLLWGLAMPVGFAAFWFVANLRRGETVWAVIFGFLLGLSIAIEISAWVIRITRRRRAQVSSN